MLISAPRVIPVTAGPLAGPAGAVLAPGYVDVTGGVITEVGQGPPPRHADLALGRGVLMPGLIDLQVNGYFGVDLAKPDAAGWGRVARRLPETGTTAFLPTLITAPVAELGRALRFAARFVCLSADGCAHPRRSRGGTVPGAGPGRGATAGTRSSLRRRKRSQACWRRGPGCSGW